LESRYCAFSLNDVVLSPCCEKNWDIPHTQIVSRVFHPVQEQRSALKGTIMNVNKML